MQALLVECVVEQGVGAGPAMPCEPAKVASYWRRISGSQMRV